MPVILLVRHAQASFGASNYDVLSSAGEEQAAVLAERLARLPAISQVVHGRLRRQEHTAEIVLRQLSEAPRTEDARWDEYDHEALMSARLPRPEDAEDLERRMAEADDPKRVFQEVFEEAIERWVAGQHDRDYVEPYRAFRERVRDALEELVAGLAGSETAVVVTSGGVISAICADRLGVDPRGWAQLNRTLVNTSVTKLVHGRSGTTLLSMNDHAHLETVDRRLLTYR